MTAGLEAWEAALPYASTQLIECIVEGDSTFAGQVLSGTDYYSPVTRIRERLADAGINDGGHGVMNGSLDTETVSGEPSDAGMIQEPTYQVNNAQCLQANYTGVYTTAGTEYEAAVYGSRVRITFARYSGSVVDIYIDGVLVSNDLAIPINNAGGGSADRNWQAGFWQVYTGLTYGRHTVKVVLVSGSLSCLIEGTKSSGVVLHNFASRGRKAVDTPWHQFQEWAGLQVSNSDPLLVPTDADSTPGARRPKLGIYAKGINDKQGNGTTDTSAAYRAKAEQFATFIQHAGGSAIICSPWWDSANQPTLSDEFYAASILAASNTGALWLDLSTNDGAALDGHEDEDIGGGSFNPHLTQLAYQYQGDYIADALLAEYAGPAESPPIDLGDLAIAGKTVTGVYFDGLPRNVIDLRTRTT